MSVGRSRSVAVAVVGIACRLPQAPDPAALWELLRDARSAITAPPEGRWEEAPDAPRFGGFLDGLDGFDPEFFGISPREAAEMDPQQRLVLELAWEALEDARIPPARLAATSAGVYVGAIAADYAALVARGGPAAVTRHTLTGLNRGLMANRVSHLLGLRGPSLTVDSAQSSSLVAVHLAAESLRSGESAVAIAAGVHLNIGTDGAVAAGRFGALSPDGRCHTFDARANGYVRGEGGVALVLKTLDQAREDGDRVHALIAGSAVNHDGHTSGLTVPDPQAQAEVVRQAVTRAGADPSDVQYVELHGTGTKVGDPVEAAALGAALGAGRAEPLHVGSVKTNVGHLEGAAGITGLLKAVLSVSHRHLPASLNYQTPNPAIPFDELHLRVRTSGGDWPRPDRPLVAGVSSFGMGGTNCHVVVTEAPGAPEAPAETRRAGQTGEAGQTWKTGETGRTGGPVAERGASASGVLPWVLSGAGEGALRDQAAGVLKTLDGPGAPADADVALSLAVTRTAFRYRAVLAGDQAEVRDGLRALARGAQAAALVRDVARPRGRTVLVFPGQGSQWTGMAVALLRESPVFARSIEESARALAPHTGWWLPDLLTGRPGAPSADRAEVVQPTLFAVMVALARLWEAAGVRPDAVIGHSQGEIAAAHIAGALSLEQAATVVALRSRVITAIAGRGGMASVLLPVDAVRERLAGHGGRLAVAAVNGAASTVVSGDADAVAELVALYQAEGVRARAVPVDYASHSAHVEPLRNRLLEELAGITPRAAEVAFYSTVTGGPLDTAGLTAEYWYRNLREPVEFDRAVRSAVADGHDVFVESSPHPLLVDGVRESAENVVAVGTLRRDHGGLRQFLLSAGRLHCAGGAVGWPGLIGPDARLVDLPTYPFQRRRLWITPHAPAAGHEAQISAAAAAAVETVEAAAEAVADTAAEAGPEALLEIVAAGAALVLGYASGDEVDPDVTFKDLGFDSAAAVEFAQRLADATGRRPSSSLVYDHPTVRAVAAHLSGAARREEAVVTASEEPIAVVAMSGRWPGGAHTPEELWRVLSADQAVITGFPGDRGWDLARLRGAGGSVTGSGGFLHDADRFDAAFFGLSPREAAVMDPQQRLLLEAAWELYERAGMDPSAQRGSRTGVFVGVTPQEYGPRLHETPDDYQGHALTGTLTSVASGRISYTLGLEGPAITIDTACSSSLVAVHLAVQALRRGECDRAVAGGAAVMSTPGMFTEFSRQGGLAPDGRCKPFAAAADGTAWAEAVGLVLLEPLSAARRAGHPVLAVVRGSAINQDGASNGLTAPSGPSQERVIRAALASAGLGPGDVDAVEAHGTGTTLGDPIEAGAILTTYGQDREKALLLGSTKSHLGHTQAAAGVTGLVAMVQAIRHAALPATLHVDRPSPHVDWASGEVALLTEPTPWPRTGRPRRAAVSSFGISGTNAHLILEQAPEPEPRDITGPGGPLVLSAKSERALRAQAARLSEWLAGDPDTTGLARTLVTGRALFEHRAVLLGDPHEDGPAALAALAALAEGADLPGLVRGTATRRGGLAVMFTGQGSQRAGMGRELAAAFPVFADALAEVAGHLDPHLGLPIREVMFTGGQGALDTTEYTQPALFAFEVALFRLAESFGLRPTHLIGHSIGELTAAHLAGVFSLADAAALVTARGRLMQSARAGGAMAALRGTEDEIGGTVDLAAVNGPDSVVVSGDRDAVAELVARWRERGRQATPLQVSHAFHSSHMDPVLAEFLKVAERVSFAAPRLPLVSNVSGGLAGDEVRDPGYWAGHIRRAVRFRDGVETLRSLGVTDYLEAGPGGALTSLALDILGSDENLLVTAASRGGRPEPLAFRTALAELHTAGVRVDWRAGVADTGAPPAGLPTYAFQRSRFWLTPAPSAGTGATGHPVLTTEIDLADGSTVHTGRLPESEPDADAAGLAAHAARRAGRLLLRELTVETPLPAAAQVQVLVGADGGEGHRTVTVHSRRSAADPWVRHASGTLVPGPCETATAPETPDPAHHALVTELLGRSEPGRLDRLIELVQTTGAAVLGHTDLSAVPPDRGFLDGEFDSLSSVELRVRLERATGLRLPSTLVFDFPTPLAVAAYLGERIFPEQPADPDPRTEQDFRPDTGPEFDGEIDGATNDELFELIENELRLS
ncbi:beta-ketoacyl synthase N-terminal-like domain-containing protein [Sphaerisporangium sp. NPDC005289]|uniref:type I polyketide synthase n=1 Tax=Sphaerisporangium sp. NPDC005289 TaxID=3155247 RepID=UPI0033B30BAE